MVDERDLERIIRNLLPDTSKGRRLATNLLSGKRVKWRTLMASVARSKRPLLNDLVERGIIEVRDGYARVSSLPEYRYKVLKVDGRDVRLPYIGRWILLEGKAPKIGVLIYRIAQALLLSSEDMDIAVIVRDARDREFLLSMMPFLRHTITGFGLAVLDSKPKSEEDIERAIIYRLDGMPVQAIGSFWLKNDVLMVEWIDQ